jgi:hypothetical protein
MRSTRMAGVVGEYLEAYRCRLCLPAKSAVARANHAKQGQCIENGDLIVVRPTRVHASHMFRISNIAREFIARRIIKSFNRCQKRFFFLCLSFGQPLLRSCCKPLQNSRRRIDILLRPQWMIVAHCLTPVGQCERWVDFLSFLESEARLVKLEAMQRLYTGNKRRLCFWRSGIRE